MRENYKEDDDMFDKDDVVKFIKVIDEQLMKNKEIIDGYAGEGGPYNTAVLTLSELSKNLLIARKHWSDMLLYEYGVFYL